MCSRRSEEAELEPCDQQKWGGGDGEGRSRALLHLEGQLGTRALWQARKKLGIGRQGRKPRTKLQGRADGGWRGGSKCLIIARRSSAEEAEG
jgi:hypothetical protein